MDGKVFTAQRFIADKRAAIVDGDSKLLSKLRTLESRTMDIRRIAIAQQYDKADLRLLEREHETFNDTASQRKRQADAVKEELRHSCMQLQTSMTPFSTVGMGQNVGEIQRGWWKGSSILGRRACPGELSSSSCTKWLCMSQIDATVAVKIGDCHALKRPYSTYLPCVNVNGDRNGFQG